MQNMLRSISKTPMSTVRILNIKVWSKHYFSNYFGNSYSRFFGNPSEGSARWNSVNGFYDYESPMKPSESIGIKSTLS